MAKLLKSKERVSTGLSDTDLNQFFVGVEFLVVEVGFHEISPDILHIFRGRDVALRRHRAVQARNGNPAVFILAERRFVIGLNRWKTPTSLAVSPSKAGCKPALRNQNEN